MQQHDPLELNDGIVEVSDSDLLAKYRLTEGLRRAFHKLGLERSTDG